jgi:hypothetical protein
VSLPTVEDVLGESAPLLIRKIPRAGHWGVATDELPARLSLALTKVFSPGDGDQHSLYLVESDTDLHRIAIGLNSNRDSLFENLDLVGFRPDELQACNIAWTATIGTTKCSAANNRHQDITAMSQQLEALCKAAMTAGRICGRLTKGKMKTIVESHQDFGCYAIDAKSTQCKCEAA